MRGIAAVERQPARRWRVVARGLLLVGLTVGLGTSIAWAQYPPGPQVTKDGTAVLLQDYASLPLSSRTLSSYPPPINFAGQLARVNFLRSEPANAPQSSSRFFANDNNRNLYVLDKTAKTFTPYLNFEEVFPKFDNDPGYAGGLVTFAFDPNYANNGKFYTVHTEDPSKGRFGRSDQHQLARTRSERWLHHNHRGQPARGDGRPAGGARRMDGHQPKQLDVRGHGARDSPGGVQQQRSSDG